MIWAWLLGNWKLIAAVLLVISILGLSKCVIDRAFDNAETIGEITAINKGQKTTLEQIEKANEASEKIFIPGTNSKFDECLRYAAAGFERNCERYKIVEPLPD